MSRLNWVKKFICANFYSPFVVEKDEDYFKDLKKRYKLLKKQALSAGADQESINIIEKYTCKINESIRCYYNGNISTAHNKIKNYIKDCSNSKFAINDLYNSDAFLGDKSKEIQLFRARTSNASIGYKAKDMLHLPKEMRCKTGNYRFSIPGIPSFYLANTSYGCWLEMGKPSDYLLNISPVILDGTQKIFNLAVRIRDFHCLKEFEVNRVHCWLKLIILMIATSYIVKEDNRSFKSEYIVSQSVMLACKELNYDGVAYYSKRVSDDMFANTAINLALFVKYCNRESYSEICKHLKIDDSYNFSLYKNLGNSNHSREYDLRVRNLGIVSNIGNYKRQYSYNETEFYEFDKFMFASWDNKDIIPWGNAKKKL